MSDPSDFGDGINGFDLDAFAEQHGQSQSEEDVAAILLKDADRDADISGQTDRNENDVESANAVSIAFDTNAKYESGYADRDNTPSGLLNLDSSENDVLFNASEITGPVLNLEIEEPPSVVKAIAVDLDGVEVDGTALSLERLIEHSELDPAAAANLTMIVQANPEYLDSAADFFASSPPDTWGAVLEDVANQIREPSATAAIGIDAIEYPVEADELPLEVQAQLDLIHQMTPAQLVNRHTQLEVYTQDKNQLYVELHDKYLDLLRDASNEMTPEVQEALEAAEKYKQQLDKDPRMQEFKNFLRAVARINEDSDGVDAGRIRPFLEILEEKGYFVDDVQLAAVEEDLSPQGYDAGEEIDMDDQEGEPHDENELDLALSPQTVSKYNFGSDQDAFIMGSVLIDTPERMAAAKALHEVYEGDEGSLEMITEFQFRQVLHYLNNDQKDLLMERLHEGKALTDVFSTPRYEPSAKIFVETQGLYKPSAPGTGGEVSMDVEGHPIYVTPVLKGNSGEASSGRSAS